MPLAVKSFALNLLAGRFSTASPNFATKRWWSSSFSSDLWEEGLASDASENENLFASLLCGSAGFVVSSTKNGDAGVSCRDESISRWKIVWTGFVILSRCNYYWPEGGSRRGWKDGWAGLKNELRLVCFDFMERKNGKKRAVSQFQLCAFWLPLSLHSLSPSNLTWIKVNVGISQFSYGFWRLILYWKVVKGASQTMKIWCRLRHRQLILHFNLERLYSPVYVMIWKPRWQTTTAKDRKQILIKRYLLANY